MITDKRDTMANSHNFFACSQLVIKKQWFLDLRTVKLDSYAVTKLGKFVNQHFAVKLLRVDSVRRHQRHSGNFSSYYTCQANIHAINTIQTEIADAAARGQ